MIAPSVHTNKLSGRVAVVTGGLGFMGLNLAGPLFDSGARIRMLARSKDPIALDWLNRIAAGRPFELHEGDIRDTTVLPKLLDGADVVVSLAGESGALKSLQHAQADVQVNVIGHLRLLEAVQHLRSRPRVVFVSSRLVYGITGRDAVAEGHPTQPTSLYGLHKLTVEHYHRLYRQHYGIEYSILRVTNSYGPFQLPNRRTHGIVNQFVLSALAGDELNVYGDGTQLRDYVYASDVASAIMLAAVHDRAVGATFNVGAGSSVQLEDVARRIVKLVGRGAVKLRPWPEDLLKVETGDFVCDTTRVREQLGWIPQVGLDQGLVDTIQRYREFLKC